MPLHTFRRLPLNGVTLSDRNLISSSFCQLLKTHSTVSRHCVLGDPNTMVINCEESQYANALFHQLGLTYLAQSDKNENFGNKGNIQNNSQTTGNIKVSTCLQDNLVAHVS